MNNSDPNLTKQIERLHSLTIYGRWLTVLGLWLTLGSLGIWGLRSEFLLWQEYFTWSAVRYSLAYNRLSTISLAFCIGMTTAVLVWQSKVILRGLSDQEKYRLKQEVEKIRESGPDHPLWKWVIKNDQ